MADLTETVVLVTGGSRGIGAAVSRKVAALGQMVAFAVLFYSVYSFKNIAFSAGVEVKTEHAVLHWMWILGFAAPVFISIYQFFVIPDDAKPGGSFLKAQLAVPLYASMAMGTGTATATATVMAMDMAMAITRKRKSRRRGCLSGRGSSKMTEGGSQRPEAGSLRPEAISQKPEARRGVNLFQGRTRD